jgi:tRNA U34 2-thiouridine synthase MnmA/TrmU
MFEFHGWVTIVEGWCEEQDDEALLAKNINQIRDEVKRLSEQEFGCKVKIGVANGLHHLTLHGFRNHTQTWVLELFESAGRIAKGSYGVLYIHDDEDHCYENEFQVWIMLRGKVERKKDQFLSPCMPKIEE